MTSTTSVQPGDPPPIRNIDANCLIDYESFFVEIRWRFKARLIYSNAMSHESLNLASDYEWTYGFVTRRWKHACSSQVTQLLRIRRNESQAIGIVVELPHDRREQQHLARKRRQFSLCMQEQIAAIGDRDDPGVLIPEVLPQVGCDNRHLLAERQLPEVTQGLAADDVKASLGEART